MVEPTPLKNMLVKLDHETPNRGEHKTCLKCLKPPPRKTSLSLTTSLPLKIRPKLPPKGSLFHLLMPRCICCFCWPMEWAKNLWRCDVIYPSRLFISGKKIYSIETFICKHIHDVICVLMIFDCLFNYIDYISLCGRETCTYYKFIAGKKPPSAMKYQTHPGRLTSFRWHWEPGNPWLIQE